MIIYTLFVAYQLVWGGQSESPCSMVMWPSSRCQAAYCTFGLYLQESYTYKDPITEFLECLYVNFDFDGAQHKLRECETVSTNHSGKPAEASLLLQVCGVVVLQVHLWWKLEADYDSCSCAVVAGAGEWFLPGSLFRGLHWECPPLHLETFCRIHQCISIRWVQKATIKLWKGDGGGDCTCLISSFLHLCNFCLLQYACGETQHDPGWGWAVDSKPD